MSQQREYTEYYEFDDLPNSRSKHRGRSADYDKKRRRAERILEQTRLRELFGYDVEYDD
jgi:hypothetical protein